MIREIIEEVKNTIIASIYFKNPIKAKQAKSVVEEINNVLKNNGKIISYNYEDKKVINVLNILVEKKEKTKEVLEKLNTYLPTLIEKVEIVNDNFQIAL